MKSMTVSSILASAQVLQRRALRKGLSVRVDVSNYQTIDRQIVTISIVKPGKTRLLCPMIDSGNDPEENARRWNVFLASIEDYFPGFLGKGQSK